MEARGGLVLARGKGGEGLAERSPEGGGGRILNPQRDGDELYAPRPEASILLLVEHITLDSFRPRVSQVIETLHLKFNTHLERVCRWCKGFVHIPVLIVACMVVVLALIDGVALIAIVHHLGSHSRGIGRAITPSESGLGDIAIVFHDAVEAVTDGSLVKHDIAIEDDIPWAHRTQVSLDTLGDVARYGHPTEDIRYGEEVVFGGKTDEDASHLSAIARGDGHIDVPIFRERVLHVEPTAIKECLIVCVHDIVRLGAVMSAKETRGYYPRKPIALPARLVVEEVAKMNRTTPIEVVAVFGHRITMEA